MSLLIKGMVNVSIPESERGVGRVKGYKGMSEDMTCRGMKYEIGNPELFGNPELLEVKV